MFIYINYKEREEKEEEDSICKRIDLSKSTYHFYIDINLEKGAKRWCWALLPHYQEKKKERDQQSVLPRKSSLEIEEREREFKLGTITLFRECVLLLLLFLSR